LLSSPKTSGCAIEYYEKKKIPGFRVWVFFSLFPQSDYQNIVISLINTELGVTTNFVENQESYWITKMCSWILNISHWNIRLHTATHRL